VSKLVVLEDVVIQGMAGNPRAVQQFPELQRLANALKTTLGQGCSRCQQNALARERNAALSEVKARLAGMPPDRKKLLKQTLGADQVRIVFLKPGDKKPTVLTFS